MAATSRNFLESALLLLLTAAITGLLVPLFLKGIDERRQSAAAEADTRRLREQQQFEAALARQSKVIESQSAFLDGLADRLWEYQLLLIAVGYYHQFPTREDAYRRAVEDYLSRAGGLLWRIRAEVSKSLRLSGSQETYRELADLYYGQLLRVDLKLTLLLDRPDAPSGEWQELNQFAVHELAGIVDRIIDKLAATLRLKESPVSGP